MTDHATQNGSGAPSDDRHGRPSLFRDIVATLQGHRSLTIDQLAARFPSVSWNQVFLAVDGLSRLGAVCMSKTKSREYVVSLSAWAPEEMPEITG